MTTTYLTTCPTGHRARIAAKVYDPITGRYQVLVNGTCVGWGFVTADDAIAWGVEALAEREFDDQGEWTLRHAYC